MTFPSSANYGTHQQYDYGLEGLVAGFFIIHLDFMFGVEMEKQEKKETNVNERYQR